jgi:hypothetical protein
MAAISTIDYCPTVRPTEKEFSNFLDYIEKLEREYGDNYGMVKVKFNKTGTPRGKYIRFIVIE